MKILVECFIKETGEYFHIEMEGPENKVEDLEKSVRDALGVTSSLIDIKITEIVSGTIH